MATGDLHKKFREDRSSGSRAMPADKESHTQTARCTDRQTDCNTLLPYWGGVTIIITRRTTMMK